MAEKTVTMMVGPGGEELKGEDRKVASSEEAWSTYVLDDGTTIRLKIVAVKISRAMDEAGNIFYKKDDKEPLYSVKFQALVAADVPGSLLKKG